MPMCTCTSSLWRSLRAGWYHDDTTIAHASLGDDVLSQMFHVAARTLQRRHLHATVVVEMHMQRRQRDVVVAMKILHQAPGEVARGVVIDINQRGDAFARHSG